MGIRVINNAQRELKEKAAAVSDFERLGSRN
jgi:hypothetical protein